MDNYLMEEEKDVKKSSKNRHKKPDTSKKKKIKSLKKGSIKRKLVGSFSVIMILFTITILGAILTCLSTANHIRYLKSLYDINEICNKEISSTLVIQNNMLNIRSNDNKQSKYVQDLKNSLSTLTENIEDVRSNKYIDSKIKEEWLNSITDIQSSQNNIINTYSGNGTQKSYIDSQNKYIEKISLLSNIIKSAKEKIKVDMYKSLSGISIKAFIFIGGLIVLYLVSCTISKIAANKLTSNILKPIDEIEKISKNLANGKLENQVNYQSDDELGLMLENINNTTKIISTYINNISYNLDKLANGDMNVELDIEYVGEYNKIKNSMISISNSLNDTFYAINVSTEQVANGAEQVASGSQELSHGAVEQSCSIDNLSNSINEITKEAENNSNNAMEARKFAEEVHVKVGRGNELMNEMLNAINDISNMSTEIGKIVKNIDSIAFQTNILSLNAAVEAARAGEAGRGFSVVADEVGVLSKKSAESAHSTTDLINHAIEAINKGSVIAQETAKALEEIVSVTEKSTSIIADIANGTDKQMQSINQVALGVEQITAVVQTNSATAEESAAASEELSGQAESLKNELSKFKLKDVTNNN